MRVKLAPILTDPIGYCPEIPVLTKPIESQKERRHIANLGKC